MSCRSCLSHRSNQAGGENQATAQNEGLEGLLRKQAHGSAILKISINFTSKTTKMNSGRLDSNMPPLQGSWFQLLISKSSGSPA
jgi:hypothetical protein